MKNYYHATAKLNLRSIRKLGLLTSQRQKNRYGLDYALDYEETYGSVEEGERYKKPLSIHITDSLKMAKEYQQMISEFYGVEAVILRIRLKSDSAIEIFQDPEEPRHSYYCEADIPPTNISLYLPDHEASLFSTKKRHAHDVDKTSQDKSSLDFSINLS